MMLVKQKIIFTLVCFLASGFVVSTKLSLAAADPFHDVMSNMNPSILKSFCRPTQSLFDNIATDQPQQSIVRFGYNYDTVRYLKATYNVFGMSADTMIRCVPGVGVFCAALAGTPMPTDCPSLLAGYNQADPGKFAGSSVSGSILGLYYQADHIKSVVGSPFDMRYFASEEFKNVPFVGTALAAGAPEYRAPFITDVYFIWKIMRNLAFGALSLIMLVIGVMMINRSRINPQTVVTIQYALPKIIIAVVLIAFSYPIGATLTNFFYYGAGALNNLAANATAPQAAKDLGSMWDSAHKQINVGSVFMYIITAILASFVIGVVALIVGVLVCLVCIVQLILIVIKFFNYYIKMVFEVVLSPFSFVISAVPGNDDRVMNWFKKMLAYGVSLMVLEAGTFFVIFLGVDLAIHTVANFTATTTGAFTAIGGLNVAGGPIIGIVELAVVFIAGLGTVLKMPAMIEEALIGAPGKKKK